METIVKSSTVDKIALASLSLGLASMVALNIWAFSPIEQRLDQLEESHPEMVQGMTKDELDEMRHDRYMQGYREGSEETEKIFGCGHLGWQLVHPENLPIEKRNVKTLRCHYVGP